MDSSSLQAKAVAQFDSLVQKGELFWSPSDEIKIEQQPFNVYFRISNSVSDKPYNPNDTSRRPGFLDDDQEFTIATVWPGHKLILNKFCWVRPQLILHTREFESQRDLLAQADFEASLETLALLDGHYIAIFNGGPDAGSSVAHKHLQIFPRPDWKLFGDEMLSGRVSLPFRYRHTTINQGTTGEQLFQTYSRMCEELGISSGSAHNMLLVSEWMLVIPRSCANIQGHKPNAPIQGGANAMLGMEWLKSRDQLENWEQYGPMKALTEFGVSSQD
ncbi:hypothetical protein K431DRAFT_284247 [Polychaeton citri CBS 116435]|uniref:Ap4A phosphorylase II n=1 Tax=Polychaeton citri CBS 116435 TaxID=1314669 RepID=A0A9P4URG3_9PEZI|nr:hypothetical protein K431DRAFT_284247 [Polychaeton citri CBS 116435]